MSLSGLPFADFRSLLGQLPETSHEAAAQVDARNSILFGSADTAGRLAKLQAWLAAWSGVSPAVRRPLVAVFAGTHGSSPAGQRRAVGRAVDRIAAGGAPVNQICASSDIGLKVFDLALEMPVGDIRLEDALDEQAAAATMAFGMEAVAGGVDLIALADCSAASVCAPAAIFAALHGGETGDWTADAVLARDAGIALERVGDDRGDPLEILRRLGGREVCAIAGAILAARVQHVPVLLEGPAALSAAAVLHAMGEDAIGHCMVSQQVATPARRRMVDALGLEPVLDLSMRLEEGEGAALAVTLARMAALMHSGTVEMAAEAASGG